MANGKVQTVSSSDAAELEQLSMDHSEPCTQRELLRKMEEQAKNFFAKFEVPLGHEDQAGFHYDR